MTVAAVDASTATSLYSQGTTAAPAKQTMDSDVFMKLLITQLQTQDPSAPMDSNQMITQTSQLASMQQLTSLGTTTTENFSLQMRIAAASMIGKTASYTDSKGITQTGTVSAVSFAAAVPTVTINGTAVNLDLVSGISTTASA
ncbi:flagellar hook capping FlgD N-terminal domain-containing protein [Galbitalea soli]|uniref:Flagellar hook capping protein n=1 Tax=Galbitalea soli TaxID=1268042 RepID=A0A7C9TR27_9MICO|nr:flagellar hook capping FlgD N-terminal domain-containing protein [Galbitalea soli]NEM91180.1 flagellar hook capping protein [Galbitalea soli]NYJ29869.1 flagellar basal-body rod modification protein FlgD [Galbitalea soli]